MTCKNGSCDFDSRIHRPVRLTKEQKRYAELWNEVELPKLLRSKSE